MKTTQRNPATQDADVGRCDDDACPALSRLVIEWQATGGEPVFEAIVGQVGPHVTRVVEQVLRRQGIRDPAAVDDAVSLVLDHLRRLADTSGRERPVAKFAWIKPAVGASVDRDPGHAFITCLAMDRARDVARARRRQRSVPFSQLGEEAAQAFERRLAAAPAIGGQPLVDRIRAVAAGLEPRQRLLVELLLEGKSQATIAHVLGVCEGTVSRRRGRVITLLREALAE